MQKQDIKIILIKNVYILLKGGGLKADKTKDKMLFTKE